MDTTQLVATREVLWLTTTPVDDARTHREACVANAIRAAWADLDVQAAAHINDTPIDADEAILVRRRTGTARAIGTPQLTSHNGALYVVTVAEVVFTGPGTVTDPAPLAERAAERMDERP